MPVVPTYEDRGVALQPGLNFRDTTRATGDMFGAQVGEALGSVGRGIADIGQAVAEVKDLDATNDAKDRHNGLMERVRALGYGEGGYLGTSGRDAVTGYAGYEASIRQAMKDGANGLSPLALGKYMDAANATLNGALEEGARHAMDGRKTWTVSTSETRIGVFAADAVAKAHDQDAVTQNAVAAVMELREQGRLMGWSPKALREKETELVSGMYETVARSIAGDNPIKAVAYIKENARFLSADARKRLGASVGEAALDEETRRGAVAFAAGKRNSGETPAPPLVGASGVAETQAAGGPTRARALLDHTAGANAGAVLKLDPAFATNLAAFIEDAPADVRAGLGIGFRDGPKDGEGAGRAADLTYDGGRLDAAPADVRDWARRNAGKYGLRLPSGIGLQTGDPNGGRLVAVSDGVSARASMPSLANAEDYLLTIADPRRRELARQTIIGAWELRSREEAGRQLAAKAEVWRRIDSGATPDDIPFEVRQAAGMDAMTVARDYYTKKLADQAIVTNPEVLRNLRLTAASKSEYFANLDLNDFRHSLSDGDYRDLTERQAGIIENDREAREKGPDLVTAFDMAKTQLEAAGVLKPKEEETEEDRQRLANFQNDLWSDIAALQKEKPGHTPNQFDFQRIINKLLLHAIITTPGVLWDSKTPARLFDTRHLKDGQTSELNILPEDIPVDLRGGIRKELAMELAEQPTDKQVGAEYAAIVEGRPRPFAGTRRNRELALGIRRDAALKGR